MRRLLRASSALTAHGCLVPRSDAIIGTEPLQRRSCAGEHTLGVTEVAPCVVRQCHDFSKAVYLYDIFLSKSDVAALFLWLAGRESDKKYAFAAAAGGAAVAFIHTGCFAFLLF